MTPTWLSNNITHRKRRNLGFGNSTSLVFRVSDLAWQAAATRYPTDPGRRSPEGYSIALHTQGIKLSYRTYKNTVQKQM